MRLTPAERVFVYRMTSGLTQRQAATKWSAGFWEYRAWEENPNAVPDRVRRKLSKLDVSKHLRYVILRRRHGMTQSDLAKAIGCSRQWINRMENDLESDQLLRDYWTT
jgi:DNA-binding XRE family transcriptional regulator